MENPSLHQKLIAGFSGILLILLAFGIMFFQNYSAGRAVVDQRRESFMTLLALERLYSDVRDIENSKQSYVLSEDSRFLEPYEAAKTSVYDNLTQLHSLSSEEPEQLQVLEQMGLLINNKIIFSEQTIQFQQEGMRDEALANIQDIEGQLFVEDIRLLVNEMRAREDQQLTRVEQTLEQRTRAAFLIGGIFSTAILIILMILYRVLQQEMIRRQNIQRELRQSLRRERLTRQIIRSITQEQQIEHILQITATAIGCFADVDRCLIYLWNQKNDKPLSLKQFSVPGVSSFGEEDIPEPDVMKDLWLRSKNNTEYKNMIVINTPEEVPEPLKPGFEKGKVKSALGVQICTGSQSDGAIFLHQCKHSRTWEKEEILLLGQIALHLSLILEQREFFQQAQEAQHEAEASNRQKSRVLGFVSHDLKNPLNGMDWVIRSLRQENLDNLTPHQQESFELLESGVNQLRSMVKNILDKARLEAGQLKLSPEPVDLNLMLAEVESLIKPLATEKSVTINWGVDSSLSTLEADPTYFRQILLNLLSNAIKFNRPHGSVFITAAPDNTGRWAEIKVHDTGIGIPPDQLDKLFQEYYRVDVEQAQKVEGTGLGLAFARKLVELHGGSVEVESEKDQGSTFIVRLPLTAIITTPAENSSIKSPEKLD